MERFTKSFLCSVVVSPSIPKPTQTESVVVTPAPSSNAFAVRTQAVAFSGGPGGGPATVQPPRSDSNEVSVDVPSTITEVSSMNEPMPCVPQSLAYEIDTSTCLPAYADRSIDHSCQPPELPVAAFQVPVVPVGEQSAPW